MNNKELIAALADTNALTQEQVATLLSATAELISTGLIEEKTISIQGFGVFELRKKNERISVHPATKQRTLIPPKLVMGFKQSSALKEKLKSIST